MEQINRVVLVTGAARGIGKAIADKFIENNDTVILADINSTDLDNALKSYGKCNNVDGMIMDVTSYSQVHESVSKIINKYGPVDILINNAGITKDAQLINMTEEMFDAVVAVNLKGVFCCTKAVVPDMIKNGYGKIINISSVVAHNGNFGQCNYAAAKAGVIAMTKTWAKELGKKGINVNALAPGYTLTEMVMQVPEKILDGIKDKVPLKRLGKPDEIAEACFYLASEKASFIHGAVINIDGGLVL